MKKCSLCRNYLDDEFFNFYKNSLQTFCKQCQSEYAKSYRKSNKETLRSNLRKWRSQNRSDRTLSEKQKLEEEFRASIRRLIKSDSSRVNKKLGYSSKDIRKFLIDSFGRLPDSEYVIKYKVPLKEFNLATPEEWQKAGSFDNLLIVKKS